MEVEIRGFLKKSSFIIVLLFLVCSLGCSKPKEDSKTETISENTKTIEMPVITKKNDLSVGKEEVKKEVIEDKKPEIKVTFIELGSVKCIPCKMMAPIIKEIEEEYKDQVKVVFYDVWTPDGKPYAGKYRIKTIPTQVFLDKDGKEYFRHEGYFPKEEIIKVLKNGGVKE